RVGVCPACQKERFIAHSPWEWRPPRNPPRPATAAGRGRQKKRRHPAGGGKAGMTPLSAPRGRRWPRVGGTVRRRVPAPTVIASQHACQRFLDGGRLCRLPGSQAAWALHSISNQQVGRREKQGGIGLAKLRARAGGDLSALFRSVLRTVRVQRSRSSALLSARLSTGPGRGCASGGWTDLVRS